MNIEAAHVAGAPDLNISQRARRPRSLARLLFASRVGVVALAAAATLPFLSSCAAARSVPDLEFTQFTVQGFLNRDSFEVRDPVEGSSDTLSILFGIVQIIEGNKLKLFWIPFFEDRSHTRVPAYLRPGSELVDWVLPAGPIHWLEGLVLGRTEERAYYDAIAKSPEADFVLEKGSECRGVGVPLFVYKQTVTYRGKPVVLKTDAEKQNEGK
ncbi:MAG: hypothetical protein JXA90_14550 [Planctomycetes bacterium]|nr:hypothetical protein [Planctomycetota bacterium]